MADAPAPPVSLGRIVLVRTPGRYSGQDECAAIVTAVAPGGAIGVTLFPPDGGPTPLRDVYPADHPYAGPTTWRWPPRVETPRIGS